MADEYIRRDDFIQYLEKCKKGAAVTNLVWAAIMAIERDVRDMPAADVVPVRHGRWEKQRGLYSCSECGMTCPYDVQADVIEYWACSYCPRCGAKMDGGNEGE